MPPDRARQRGLRGIARSVLRRGMQVAGVFWRHGFGPHLRRYGLGRYIPQGGPEPSARGTELPVRLRMACEEIGPVTIKLAQTLASRPDMIPAEYAREFRKLHVNVPPVPWEDARRVLEGDLGAPVEQVFGRIRQIPAASASIAQVHEATLKDGHRVAVKVQRPSVAETVETDLMILQFVAGEAEKQLKAARTYRLREWVDEFSRSLRTELDFTTEGHNTEALRKALADDPHVSVPRVHWDHTTRRVLLLDWVDGVHVDQLDELAGLGVSRSSVAAHLAHSLLRQIFLKGIFHADPHPGNVMVQRTGEVVLLDCGNVSRIDRSMRESMVRLLLAVLEDDGIEVYDRIIDLGAVSEDTDLHQLRADLQRLMGHYSGIATSQISMGDVLEELMGIVFRHQVLMPPVFASVLRALIIVEGTCRLLSPGYDFRQPAAQIGREVLHDWFQPSNMLRGLWRSVRDVQRYGMLIPRQVSELLSQIQVAGVTVRFEGSEHQEALRRADAMANRLAFALVVAAMIVGSSVMLASERATALLSTPGAVAYVIVGALLGLYLLYSILVSGRR